MPYPFNHPSGVPNAYDRHTDKEDFSGLIFREDKLAQAAELNELQSIITGRGIRTSGMVAKDGDRISGADIRVNTDTGVVRLDAGEVYIRGDVRQVAKKTLNGVTMVGEITIGVRITSSVIDETDDPDLLGLHPGSEAEGEPGAARFVETVTWGWSGDGEEGDLFDVYLMKDGVVIDQTPPPDLTGVNQAIAVYDRDAHGHYIVDGCRVKPLGKKAGAQHFAIGEGTANIMGFKFTREHALRHIEDEEPDLEQVVAEVHTLGASPSTMTLNHFPLASVVTLIIEKETTETVTKGVSGSQDNLSNNSVLSLVEVKQGAVVYNLNSDYLLTADNVDWSPVGAEPLQGSSYTVKYRYLDEVNPSGTTNKTVTATGGRNGGQALITYTYKLPRVDILGLNRRGMAVYIKGIPDEVDPRPPIAPWNVLALCEIRNDWMNTPDVENNGVRAYPFKDIDRMYRRMIDMLDLIALERLKSDIDSREPVAKKGVFVDPLINDFYRDEGETQTLAVFDGVMTLAIDPTVKRAPMTGNVMLDYTEEIIVRQTLATGCMEINPYDNFTPPPAQLEIDPPTDFWTEKSTIYLSDITRRFVQTISIPGWQNFGQNQNHVSGGSSSTTVTEEEIVDEKVQKLEFLRQIDIDFRIEDFGPGEILDVLEFDGIDVKPPGTITANGSGVITGTFTIPEDVAAGTKIVYAEGLGGSKARTRFTGQGRLITETIQRTTTITVLRVFDRGNDGNRDPLAQTFSVEEPRYITGIDVKFCAKGDPTKPVDVEIVTVENGIPTRDVWAQTRVRMNTVVLNEWHEVTFRAPVFLPSDRQFAFVFQTEDPLHALSIATLGAFDAVNQKWVSAQPYTVGVLLSSSNARTWTPHQKSDLTFRIRAAVFAPTTKTVNLGTHSVTNCSDLMVRAACFLPTEDATIEFEIERANGTVKRLAPDQVWQLKSYITEDVVLRAILKGTAKVSPVLLRGVLLVAGSLRGSGVYVTRAFDLGTAVRLSMFIKRITPAGSTLAVQYDKVDDNWDTMNHQSTVPLNEGWSESEYRRNPLTGVQTRLKITLTGTPAARPFLTDMRAVSI